MTGSCRTRRFPRFGCWPSACRIAILFDLLLKTARAALIDHAGRKADLRISYLLFEKVLNSSLAARPQSTGRICQPRHPVRVRARILHVEHDQRSHRHRFRLRVPARHLCSRRLARVIPAVAFVVSVIVGLVAQHRIGKCVAAAMNESSQRQALLVESISTLETIKSLQAESYLLRKWREHSKNAANTSEQIKQLSAAPPTSRSSSSNW